VGAFKARGASNAVFSLSEDEAARSRYPFVGQSWRGARVCSGTAAFPRGSMPDNASAIKQANVRGFGGHVRLCTPTAAAREASCVAVQAETGAC
jgi:threonine dehydratase